MRRGKEAQTVTFMEDGDEFLLSFDKTATLYAADGFEQVPREDERPQTPPGV